MSKEAKRKQEERGSRSISREEKEGRATKVGCGTENLYQACQHFSLSVARFTS